MAYDFKKEQKELYQPKAAASVDVPGKIKRSSGIRSGKFRERTL